MYGVLAESRLSYEGMQQFAGEEMPDTEWCHQYKDAMVVEKVKEDVHKVLQVLGRTPSRWVSRNVPRLQCF